MYNFVQPNLPIWTIATISEYFKHLAMLYEDEGQGDQKNRKKCRIFQKVAQAVSKPKKAKISIAKLNLKSQNIYIKPFLKPSKYLQPTMF